MKKFLLALSLAAALHAAAPIDEAKAADFLVTSPTIAALNAVAQNITGLWVPDSTDQNGNDVPAHIAPQGVGNALGGWAWIMFPNNGAWEVATGQFATGPMGNVPVYAPKDSNVYGILRFNGDPALLPLPKGVTLVTDPTTGAMSVTVGPVTMTSPLPADVLIRFE